MANKIIFDIPAKSRKRIAWFNDQVKAKEYPNASTLAERFGISSKTGDRDIEIMQKDLKCPLKYDKSKKGYYYADDSFSLPMTYLSSDELSSLLLARKLLQDISGDYVKNELTTILDKISKILSIYGDDISVIDKTFSLQIIGYSPTPEDIFKDVFNACTKKRRISFAYLSPNYDNKTERTVDPYHLLNYMGTWHLLGYCHLREELRDFVLRRMSDLTVLDRQFHIERFNMQEYLESAFGIFKGDFTDTVTLRFSPHKAKWIEGQIWHKDQTMKKLPDGSLELSFPVATFLEVKMEILKHGSDVVVVEPEELKNIIRAEAEKIAGLY